MQGEFSHTVNPMRPTAEAWPRMSVTFEPRKSVNQLLAGKLDRKEFYPLLERLNRMHSSGVVQGRTIVRDLMAPRATECLREIAKVARYEPNFRALLMEYACTRLQIVYGAGDPQAIITAMAKEKPPYKATSFELFFALRGWDEMFPESSQQYRNEIARLMLRAGLRDGRAEMIGNGDFDRLVSLLSPLRAQDPSVTRRSSDDPVKAWLYKDISINNPAVPALLAGKVDPVTARELVGWLLHAQQDEDEKVRAKAKTLLAHLIAPPSGKGQEHANAALRDHSLRQLADHFGTNNLQDPALRHFITPETVRRLSLVEWFHVFQDVSGKEYEALARHVRRCLKANGATEVELLALKSGTPQLLSACVSPVLRPCLDTMLTDLTPRQQERRREWMVEMFDHPAWRAKAKLSILDDGQDSALIMEKLDMLCEFADGRTAALTGYGTNPDHRTTINRVLRARLVFADLVDSGSKSIHNLLQQYANLRYKDELPAIFAQLTARRKLGIRRRLFDSLSPVAMFFAFRPRKEGPYKHRGLAARALAKMIPGGKRATDGRKYLFKALHDNDLDAFFRHYKNEEKFLARLGLKLAGLKRPQVEALPVNPKRSSSGKASGKGGNHPVRKAPLPESPPLSVKEQMRQWSGPHYGSLGKASGKGGDHPVRKAPLPEPPPLSVKEQMRQWSGPHYGSLGKASGKGGDHPVRKAPLPEPPPQRSFDEQMRQWYGPYYGSLGKGSPR